MNDTNNPSARIADIPSVDKQFIDRWSPRAFSSEPIAHEQIIGMIAAARWAPSCFNEQPWLFAYATDDEDRAQYQTALNDKNRLWAAQAPVLIILFARKHFEHNGSINHLALFDSGAAWMSLALQARKYGLDTHAMAGFNADTAHNVTGISQETHTAICMIAAGKRSDKKILPAPLQEREQPNQRKNLQEIMIAGSLHSTPSR